VHIDVVDALVGTVYPRAYAPYPLWVLHPRSDAEFIASILVHARDDLLPEKFRSVAMLPLVDSSGYVTALPLMLKGGAQ
jgi:hypothetical protein